MNEDHDEDILGLFCLKLSKNVSEVSVGELALQLHFGPVVKMTVNPRMSHHLS